MVEVTQADRIAAASVAVLVEMRELILAGKADHHAEPWAMHRLAGVKAGLYAAAEKADELFFGGEDEAVATVIANNIRAIDPASVGADHDA